MAWLAKDEAVFNRQVGWANILALPVGVIGIVLVIVERLHGNSDTSMDRMTVLADKIARDVERAEAKQLASLIGTDRPEVQPIDVGFQVAVGQLRKQPTARILTPTQVVEYFLNEAQGRLLVLGEAGSGKTVLIKEICLNLIQSRDIALRQASGVVPVPVIFNLSMWPPDEPIETWLQKEVSLRFGVSPALAVELVQNGWILAILDALDEMDGDEVEAGRAVQAVQDIGDYIAASKTRKAIITSRSGEPRFDRIQKRFRHVHRVAAMRLSAEQIADYVERQADSHDAENWQPLLTALSQPQSIVRRAFSRPWHLTMAVAYLKIGGEVGNLLPTPGKASTKAYEKNVRILLNETYLRIRCESPGNYWAAPNSRRRRAVLSALARMLSEADARGGSRTEIVLHDLWRQAGTRNFLALRVASIYLATHLGFTAYSLFHDQFERLPGADDGRGDTLFLVQLASNMLLMMFLGVRLMSLRKSPLVIQFSHLLTPRGSTLIVVGLGVSSVLGWWTGSSTNSLLLGVSTALTIATPFVATAVRLSATSLGGMRPITILARDLRATIILVPLAGLTAGTYYAAIMDVQMGIIFGLGYAGIVLVGSAAWTYMLAVLATASKWHTPIWFAKYLEWGVSAGVLRRSGIGYAFRHKELQEHLARA